MNHQPSLRLYKLSFMLYDAAQVQSALDFRSRLNAGDRDIALEACDTMLRQLHDVNLQENLRKLDGRIARNLTIGYPHTLESAATMPEAAGEIVRERDLTIRRITRVRETIEGGVVDDGSELYGLYFRFLANRLAPEFWYIDREYSPTEAFCNQINDYFPVYDLLLIVGCRGYPFFYDAFLNGREMEDYTEKMRGRDVTPDDYDALTNATTNRFEVERSAAREHLEAIEGAIARRDILPSDELFLLIELLKPTAEGRTRLIYTDWN